MPEYENEPDDVSEDDNGLPALSGLATDAEVSFMERFAPRLHPIRTMFEEARGFFERVQEREQENHRRRAIENAKSRCKMAWVFASLWCGLALFHVAMMAWSGPNPLGIGWLVGVSIIAGWQIKEIRIAHEKYEEELSKPLEEW